MQSSYMKIPLSPSSNEAGRDFPVIEDYSDVFAFFQDAVAAIPVAQLEMPVGDGGSGGGGTKRKGFVDTEGSVEDNGDDSSPCDSFSGSKGSPEPERKRSKTVGISQLITSLAMLEEEDRTERENRARESCHELAMLEANHRQKAKAMTDYRSYLHDHHSDADESETLRGKRARVAAAAVAAAAATGAAGPSQPQQQHHRRLWVKDRSQAWWDQCNHPDFPEAEFRKAFRMSRRTFDMICEELGAAVAKEDTMLRAAIPVRQRVAVCIWRLATGEPLRLVSKRFGLGISTCHKLVLEVCAAIKSVLMPKFLQWPSEVAAEAIKARFEAAAAIPNVIGAMYTTHIPIIAPKISVAAYFNKRHTERNQKTSYSITIQGVVDPDGVFTDVCIGWPGSMSDEQVLEKSALQQRAAGGMLKDKWVVGGAGYPLLDWVLVPYAHQNLTWTQHAFNEKMMELQGVAKAAFARLKGRWTCLQKRTEVKLQDLPGVLGACCVLHNICEMNKEEMEPELEYELVDDEMVPENGLRSLSSMQARESIAHNLLHCGLAGTAFF